MAGQVAHKVAQGVTATSRGVGGVPKKGVIGPTAGKRSH
jgi:hypothetical protein